MPTRTKQKFPPSLQGRDLGRKGTPDENTVPEGVGVFPVPCFGLFNFYVNYFMYII